MWRAGQVAELKKRVAELELLIASADELIKALQAQSNGVPRLITIKREGRALTLVFERDGERFEFETYSTMSSDIKGLLQWANLT